MRTSKKIGAGFCVFLLDVVLFFSLGHLSLLCLSMFIYVLPSGTICNLRILELRRLICKLFAAFWSEILQHVATFSACLGLIKGSYRVGLGSDWGRLKVCLKLF